uniref:Small ribosomal subunit protein uS3c n=1 Tax=Pandorina colemaniae TaxID=47786 RepID=A0A6C0RUT6_9CHLO|nr:ribosomal protein S3 [Pandorina colemaniae]
MGQKVHPLGFRVGITKKHQSQWFARFQKYGYAQSVFEDHMLRKTLLNLFNNLNADTGKLSSFSTNEKENGSVIKASKKAGTNLVKKPKITQIKIERGLIPYEIGIQIHSDDCLSMTKAIDNIKLSTDLVSKLQKTRKFLYKAGSQLKKIQTIAPTDNLSLKTENKDIKQHQPSNNKPSQIKLKKRKITPTQVIKIKGEKKIKGKSFLKFKRKQKKRLSKSVFMRLKNLKRRFKKRQIIKKRYLNIISKGLLIRKKGNLIVRKVFVKQKNKNNKFLRSQAKSKNNYLKKKTGTSVTTTNKENKLLLSAQNKTNKSLKAVPFIFKRQPQQKIFSLRFRNRIYKKFANLFLTKLNKQFLVCLKGIMKYWHNQKKVENKALVAPLAYTKKWYSAKAYTIMNHLKVGSKNSTLLANYQIEKLTKLISILEKKSLVKMEILRKDFITFGTISKARAFGYYQIITFLQQLKQFVLKLKKQTLATTNLNKNTNKNFNLNPAQAQHKITGLFKTAKQKKLIRQRVVNNFINLVDNTQAMTNEYRKIKWITYLKDLVHKHRNENLFYYLATIADARKDLKALKRYTKQYSNFLFGINIENNKDNTNLLLQRVTKTLTESLKNPLIKLSLTGAPGSSESLTKLQKTFLNHIETQRKMYKSNLALTPKISIKFFSVKTSDILEKASIVAESIVDALEKRKAFRGVIKKAKEDLMRRSRVKGVKIQVSGRLNGAEIARSEWVRAGRVPLQTLRANIDYSYRTANTIYGIIGVKVWIFKGYSTIN